MRKEKLTRKIKSYLFRLLAKDITERESIWEQICREKDARIANLERTIQILMKPGV